VQGEGSGKKSKEQMEAEKRAILKQRIKPLEIDGMDAPQLSEKARELHSQILRLEGEKYDLEKRFKQLQVEVCSRSLISLSKGKGKCNRHLIPRHFMRQPYHKSGQVCHAMSRDYTVLLAPIYKWNKPYLPKLVLIYRLRGDGRLSWPRYLR